MKKFEEAIIKIIPALIMLAFVPDIVFYYNPKIAARKITLREKIKLFFILTWFSIFFPKGMKNAPPKND